MISFKEAKRAELIKWNEAKKTGKKENELDEWLKDKHPIIFGYTNQSGLCERHTHITCGQKYIACANCPILYKTDKCGKPGSLHMRWRFAKTIEERKVLAEHMWNIIEDLVEEL